MGPMFDSARFSVEKPLTRRTFLRYGGSLGASVAAASSGGAIWRAASALGATVKQPDSLPDPRRPAGTATDALPFDHIVVIMMENRWFGSAPCQTYPNRRFLMAGTAYGNIATTNESLLDPPPPNGTIWDRLHAYGISWRNYFTDLPSVGVIGSTVEKYPENLSPIAQFFADCATGSLPAVSLVDPEFGVVGIVGSGLATLPALKPLAEKLETTGGDEENPQDMSYGEYWAYKAVNAVPHSPACPPTLLIYTYDEHGGYYDHVPPPTAIAPDSILPNLGAGDVPGAY